MSDLLTHFIRSFKHHPIVQTGAIVVLTGTFSVVFSMHLFFSNMEKVLVSWGSNIEMNIFIKEGLSDDQIIKLQSELKDLDYFKDVMFVSKDKAADQFFSKMSKYIPEFAGDKEFLNIVPASLVATLAPGFKLSQLSGISSKLEALTQVEDVSYGQDWAENLAVFINSVKKVGWAISAILILGSLFVIGFTVYTVIVRRKEEIEIYELCGATQRMIQAPYIFEGALVAFASSTLALIISYVLLNMQNQLFVSELVYLGLDDIFSFFGFFEILGLLIMSTLIGAMVSYLCMQKLNLQSAKEL